jgi:iron complex transport system substrate-binding protein
MTHRQLARFAALLITIISLAACGANNASAPTQNQATAGAETTAAATTIPATEAPAVATTETAAQPTAEASAAQTAYPLTVTDALGRSVTIDAQPERIVSLAPSNTEILFEIGADEQVVGVTEFCDYPTEATQREQVGGFSAKTISVEKIVALKPDLVLSADESQQPVIDALAQLQIPVVAFKATSFEDVYANITLIGQITGQEAGANETVTYMQQRVAAVTDKIAAVPQSERPSVFWEVWDEPLMTAGPKTFIGQMIDLAGGENLFTDVTEEYPQISAEAVAQRNPDIILGPDDHADKLTTEEISQRPGWATTGAVQENRIAIIDGDIVSRPGPRLAEGLEQVAAALHPEVFNQR